MKDYTYLKQNSVNTGCDKTEVKQIALVSPGISLEIKKLPFMGFIFLKAFLIAPFRSNSIADDAIINKAGITLKDFLPDRQAVGNYRKVCCFQENLPDIIPISYLQTIFIGLLGKFITSPVFPINPLGLIHIFQSFKQTRAVAVNEIIDLACTLENIKKTDKGIETAFDLKVISDDEIVWQGVSIFLTKKAIKKKKQEKRQKEKILKPKETIFVPSDTGRRYAKVSGDYNPYHLNTTLAKLFGFKRSIAHGMWSLARVVASLDRQYGINNGAAEIEASFKLPVFIPAKINLGYEYRNDTENQHDIINFELRDEQNKLPHLKGILSLTDR